MEDDKKLAYFREWFIKNKKDYIKEKKNGL